MYEDHLTNTPSGGSFGIRSIIEDKHGKFWFCKTRHRYVIDPKGAPEKGKGLINYNKEAGMGDVKAADGNDIYYLSIIEDKKGDLWMATYRDGAWRYDGKTMTHYPIQDGGKDIKLYSVYQDNQGNLWLGTHDGGAYRLNGKTFEKFRP
ncbi:MAG: two-component regulator propeller domain-containing protein [Gemmatales bacterium]